MRGYLTYAFVIIFSFVLWGAFFIFMRSGADKKRDIAGIFLLGPMYTYLQKRKFTLSMREVIGWGAVLILMLAAPLISRLLT